MGVKDFNSDVWDAGWLAQNYPTLLFQPARLQDREMDKEVKLEGLRGLN